MTGRIDAAARAKFIGALRGLWTGNGEVRLRRPWRPVTARGCARAAIGLTGLVLALALTGAVALFSMLAAGPIDLEALKPRIVASLQERLGPPYKVSIGPTFLTHGPSGLGLGFSDIEIRDGEGRTVIAAPGGRVGLDALALLSVDVKVRRLELDGLEIKLRVRPDGTLSVAAASAPDAAPIELGARPQHASNGEIGAILGGLVESMAGARQSLDRVTIANGQLDIENEALHKSSVYRNLTVTFEKGDEQAAVAVSAQGPSGNWSATAIARGGASRSLSLDARDLSLDDLLLVDAGRPPFTADMPISFKFDASLGADNSIQTLTGSFGLGAGYFKLDDPDHEPFLIDEATGRVVWDPQSSQYRIEDVEMLTGASHFRVSGWAAPPSAEQPAWRGRLESHDSVLAGERPGELPVAIDEAVFDAHFLPEDSRFVLDRFSLHGPRLKAEMTAEAAAVTVGSALKMDMQIGPSGLADVFRLWPTFINPEARAWCLEHIHGGDLVSASMKVDWDASEVDAVEHKRPVPADSVHGEFLTHDAAVDLMPGVPDMTGLDASGLITGHIFSVAAKHGTVELAPGRRIQANDIYFKIPDTSPAPIVASQAGAHLQGGADALADLLSRDAVKKHAGFSVDPANVKGQFQGQLTLDLGLGKSVRPEDQRFRAEGALSNLQLDKFMSNERFEQGALEVVADPGNLKITGQGQLNGMPAKVELAKGVADDGALVLNLTLDDAARAKLGLNAGPAMTGPMSVRIKAPLNKSGADVEVDLAKVAIDTPDGSSLKAAGKPGKATFTVKTSADSVAVSALAIDAGSMTARGSAQFGVDGSFQNAKLSQLRVSAGDDLKLDLQAGSPMKATLRGASFDARGMVKSLLSHDPNSAVAHDLDLDVKIGSVSGANKQSIGQFELTASRRAGAIRSLQAKGQLGAGLLTAHKDDAGLLSVHTEDAGALSKFLDFYTKLEGGSLDLTLRDGPESSHGIASIKRFVLRNEPALRSLAAAGAGAGAGSAPGSRNETSAPPAPVIDPDAVKFDKMTADFTRSAGRLDLHEALIFNPQIGLTTQGFIDFARDRVDLNGTFVPAYQVNSFITGIPVVGVLLGGAKHEGIFGVNYRITGPASGPTLTVNPLSGMTPGILRKIFGALDGTTPAPNTYAPQPDQ